jgi:hypothetical protein
MPRHPTAAHLLEVDEGVLILPNLLHLAAAGHAIELRQHLRASHIAVLLPEVPEQAAAC